MIRAVVFDMDGVLLDLCRVHRKALNVALGLVVGRVLTTEQEHSLEGLPTRVKLSRLGLSPQQAKDVEDFKQGQTQYHVRNLGIDSDKSEMLRALKAAGLKTASYTNSIRTTAVTGLACAGLYPFLDEVLSNQDVPTPKPSPEGYLQAMASLRVDPLETLIVEDSDAGFQAAFESGANVVLTTHPLVTLPNLTDWITQCNS